MKILLLAPPGERRYVRDYYCSKVAKADYSYSPVDLLLLSGRFDDVVFIDAIQEKLSPDQTLARIKKEQPEAIITLASAVSWPEDHAFLARVKQALPRTPILASGDILMEGGPELMIREPWLDVILLDFTNSDAALYLAGRPEEMAGAIYRDSDGQPVVKAPERKPGWIDDLPRPRHNLFLPHDYAYPFVRHRRFATVQTDYGCPFPCRFCVMGSLGHRKRPTGEIIEELKHLQDQGIREIYFNDQTFGGTAKRLGELCRAMVEAKINLGWCCWNRVDVVYDNLELMKQAGCHTIMFGVDSAHDATLKDYRKGYTIAQVRAAFTKCRRLNIRTLGTFMLGLPGEDRAMVQQTLDLALELDPDFASFNVFVPRKGTEVRSRIAEQGGLPDDETPLDQTGAVVSVSNSQISPADLKSLRDRVVRRYYLRPSYIWRRLAGVRTVYDLQVLIRTAISMVW